MKRSVTFALALSAGIVALCFVISCFFVQLSVVSGNSMSPTYKNMEPVLLDKRDKNLQRGDVVAFRREGLGFLIKRVAAVPGDRVRISDGILYINDRVDTLCRGRIDYSGIASSTLTLGEGQFFLLGDNSGESRDSRYAEIGLVDRSEMLGTVIPQK